MQLRDNIPGILYQVIGGSLEDTWKMGRLHVKLLKESY
ncbi:hypothetical protein RINTHM_9790 [Richelia intracellularis HM01]|nr:hypothetical protein RINTHM_9790 [Richelia intracellularis HM01]